MRAAYIESHGSEEVLKIGDLPEPSPKANEVKVRLKYAALNHLDIWVRKGLPGLGLSYPHILGSDGAGKVVEVGSKVKDVNVDDSVIVHPGLAEPEDEGSLWESVSKNYRILGEHVSGTQAEYVCVPEQNVFPKPVRLDWPEASSIGLVFTTAWQMLVRRAEVTKDDRVLIHAAGSGVSSAAIQIAKVFDAEVIATAGSDAKLERAKQLGADHIVNYKTSDVLAQVKEITGGEGVEIVFDHVGAALWETNMRSLKWGGKFVTCGTTSGSKVDLDLTHVFYKQLQIMGSTMGGKADFPWMLELFDTGKLKAVVDKSFSLEEIAAAHSYVENREQFGKVLVKIG